MSHEEMAAKLRSEGWRVEEPPPPPPPISCVRCGREIDRTLDYYTDVRVEIARNEEGYANVLRYVCSDGESPCLEEMQNALQDLGFVLHYHGGINFLEPMECPGRVDRSLCPTPEAQYPD